MCRFTAYHGPRIALDEILYEPDHSLIHQSVHARERKEPLNGDGWGVGWYQPDLEPEPAQYRTIRPAWSDDNMRHISPLVHTPLYFAHVRAATPGLPVQRSNCHPFRGGLHTGAELEGEEADPVEAGRRRLLFMHNGHVGAYKKVMRRLRRELSDEVYFGIEGTTDSEHAFAVVQDALGDRAEDPTVDDLADAVCRGLEFLEELKLEEAGPDADTQANFCLTDGRSIVATRYASPEGEQAQTLYVGQAREFYTEDEVVAARGPDETGATLISSEALFYDERVWEPVPRNHMVLIDRDGDVRVQEMDVEV